MSAQPISPAEINRRNSEFWGKETPEAMRLLQMDGLLEGAMAELEEDAERPLSLAQHRGLEKAVRDFNRRYASIPTFDCAWHPQRAGACCRECQKDGPPAGANRRARERESPVDRAAVAGPLGGPEAPKGSAGLCGR